MATNPYNPGYIANGAAPVSAAAAPAVNPISASPVKMVATPNTTASPTKPVSIAPPNMKQIIADKNKKDKADALNKWLAGDTDYQQQLAEFNSQKQSYNQNYNNDINQVNQNYNSTKRGMDTQATQDKQNQQYDFAARGVLTSGVYAQALDNYNTTFNQNLDNLLQGKTQQLATDKTALNNFLRELGLQQNAAKQDAIRRRAQSLGI
jgi:flagellar biosynthesis chaperone FliJ